MTGYETGRPTTADPGDVVTHADFVTFLRSLLQDYELSGKTEWENPTLDRFLEALEALADAWPQVCRNEGTTMPEQPTWRLIAELLAGTTAYE